MERNRINADKMKSIRRLVALLLIAMLALSGCKTKDSGKTADTGTGTNSASSGAVTGVAASGTVDSTSDKTADTTGDTAGKSDAGEKTTGVETKPDVSSDTAGGAPKSYDGSRDTSDIPAESAAGSDPYTSDAAGDAGTSKEAEAGAAEEPSLPVMPEADVFSGLIAETETVKDSGIALFDSKVGKATVFGGSSYGDGSGAGGWEAADGTGGMLTGSDSFFDEDAPRDDIDILDPGDIDIIEPYMPQPAAGLLTSGEWNDNLHFDFLKKLIENGQSRDYSGYFKEWGFTPFARLAIHVGQASSGEPGTAVVTDIPADQDEMVVSGSATTSSGITEYTTGVENATVTVFSTDNRVIWRSKTDNRGMTYAFYRLNSGDAVPATVTVNVPGSAEVVRNVESGDLIDGNIMNITVSDTSVQTKKLDLMFVIDTTGSMGDEIYYLQKELENVIERVQKDNGNIPVRLSVNFYRDQGDEYVVRSNPFTADINSQLIKLNAEHADGGGDYEEAVEQALEDAVNGHDWSENSTGLMFMVLDAPPHNTGAIRQQLSSTLNDAIGKGIRIIPVASSGVDKSTEFLLRTLAMTTGGTYTFLTNDSGIGDAHIEPTIGDYEVENLNNMLVRIISGYLS
ncbi:MAG: VWA domain-containing protein [Lachnospiraceae bacterium]|nr:VWA domain-containing protein [Lachnospiraceae bacterium]